MDEKLLLHHAPAPLPLAEAAGQAMTDAEVGFLSSATAHHVVRWTGSAAHGPEGPVSLGGVFAARLVGADAELRWQHTGGGLGIAVLLTETRPRPVGWSEEEVQVIGVRSAGYAVWGRRLVQHPGNPSWCRAQEGRLGWVDLPLPAPVESTPASQGWPNDYVELMYREYLVADTFGNVSVFDERLTGLRIAQPTTGKG